MPKPIHSRATPLRNPVPPKDGSPLTVNETDRSVEVIGATENPVETIDWDRWELTPEVLLMSGCQLSETRQIPLLNTHSREGVEAVIGSFREMRIENSQLIGRACFAATPENDSTWTKVRDGHLTDFSVGYRVLEKTYIPPDTTGLVAGNSYVGPMNVVTSWKPREMSACPIGADEAAKARAAQTPGKKENHMDKEFRKFLESRGLSATATDEEARAYAEKLGVREEVKPANPPELVDADAIRAEASRTERTRITQIRAMCEKVGFDPTKTEDLITEGISYEAARSAILDFTIERSAAANPGYRPPLETGADERDKFRSAAQDSLLLRAGSKLEKPADGAIDLRGYSLRELARECLRMEGKQVGGDMFAMVGRALTTSDFPNLLANTANKFLLQGYTAQSETWNQWCGTGSVADFKANTLNRAGETDDLDQILEDAEYKHGKRSESKETYQIATYGKMFSISRQAIINDDLNALSDIPTKHGEAAARKVGDIAYAVLTANAAMGDGTALFHSDHGNLAGTSAVISTASIAAGIAAMRKQKDMGGKQRLNIRPQFIIIPAALEGTALIFLNTANIGSTANAGQANLVNPYFQGFTLVVDPRLDDASATAWYLAGPSGKTVNVYFLNGNQTPYMETRQGFDVDGVQYKVRIDAGAKAVDWRAMLKNAGA